MTMITNNDNDTTTTNNNNNNNSNSNNDIDNGNDNKVAGAIKHIEFAYSDGKKWSIGAGGGRSRNLQGTKEWRKGPKEWGS